MTLRSTFQHIPGISPRKEQELWRSGILTWDDFERVEGNQLALFDFPKTDSVSTLIEQSHEALSSGDVDFFADLLDRSEYYRIALSFPSETMFLDIETTGLSRYYDKVTLVGWSFLEEYGVFIRGGDDGHFREAISQAKAIVTFNGSLFDLPFLRKEFPGIVFPRCHIDLRFFARRVGLSGGQKEVEEQLNLNRNLELKDIKGEAAALLWFKYRWGNEADLESLVRYNHADIEGMKVIFDNVVSRLLSHDGAPVKPDELLKFSEHRSEVLIASTEPPSAKGISLPKFVGKPGPAIHLNELCDGTPSKRTRIVGIDLTGSETRLTGWCFLDHDYAITKRLGSDRDLIRETVEMKPDLVSIDSPLSLPKGRVSVTDDDPGRRTYGIMRECERILKRRGINVYPSLIPSMQKLTERGIQLAKEFRSLGLPVVESYPGAAQDILEIPRKRASLELLAKGMEQFGVRGEFLSQVVSHDELDAITSAMVGHFFWSGRFEALGNEEEDYLIIPDLKADCATWIRRTVVGISGAIASGKTTAGRFLEKRGYSYGRFSLVLKRMLEEKGMPPSRENLQGLGDEVNTIKGQRWLCKRLVAILPDDKNLVVDGLRFPEDHAFLREKFGPRFFHVHLTATQNTRRIRYMESGADSKEFDIASSHHVERMVNDMKGLADAIFENDGNDLSYFERGITEVIEQALNKENAKCQLV